MRVINKLETKDERWHVGDVIEYGDGFGDSKCYGMVVSKTAFINDGSIHSGFSVMNLDGRCAGFLAYSDTGNAKWFGSVDQLQRTFLKNWSHAKKVPFYGVVGKLEED